MERQEPPVVPVVADATVGEPVRSRGLSRSPGKQIGLPLLALAAVGTSVGAVMVWTSDDEPHPDGNGTHTLQVSSRPGQAHEDPPRQNERRTVSFGHVPSFRQAVLAAGLSPEEATIVEGALATAVDFSRCHEEDRLVTERSASGALISFEYHPGPIEFLRVRIGSNGQASLERESRPVERTRRVVGTSINLSVANSLEELGLPRSLGSTLVELFDGQVTFSTDVRTGDQLRLIVDEERVDGRFHRTGTLHAVEYDGQATGRLLAIWFARSGEHGDYYDGEGRPLSGSWLRVPLAYDRISSPFNPRRRHPILRRVIPHTGVDYAAPSGAPVWAAAGGRVTVAGVRGPNGNLVSIQHDNGFETHYAHLSRFATGLGRGVVVTQRQTIGYVGSTGRSTGPHLHFGLRRAGRFIDPLPELRRSGPALTGAALAAFSRTRDQLVAELSQATFRPTATPAPAPEQATLEEPMD